MNLADDIKRCAQAIRAADAILITAGAGMGVDSGLPDFRGSQGFWQAYPVIAKLGLSFEEMADPTWFDRDPGLAWAFYGHRLNLYRSTVPHAGFGQILELARNKPQGYFVFTSNVDGQFQKAGYSPEHIVECHGSIHHFQCTALCTQQIWDAGEETVKIDEALFRALEPLPRCRHCPALARPNILMFGDWSWIGRRAEAQHAAFTGWLGPLLEASARLAVIELGAGTAIPTVRRLSETASRQLNGTLIRINPREDGVPEDQVGLPLPAALGIQMLYDAAAAL